MPKNIVKNDKKEPKEKKHFFKDFKAELKRVIWPTPKQLVNNTVAVITIVLITAVIVFALDFIFNTASHYGIEGLKGIVGTNTENSQSNEETAEDSTEDTDSSQTNSTNETQEATNNTVNE